MSEAQLVGEAEKQVAAEAGAALVSDGMLLGIGSGSTVALLISALASRVVREGLSFEVVAASRTSRRQAIEAGLTIIDLPKSRLLDLALDGADEVAPNLDLIKGGGGALLHERIIATSAREFVILADSSKCVPQLGQFPLPVEVHPFGMGLAMRWLTNLGLPHQIRLAPGGAGKPFLTDAGNWILDCRCGTITDADELAASLEACPAVAAHGLFLAMTSRVMIAIKDRVVRLDQRS